LTSLKPFPTLSSVSNKATGPFKHFVFAFLIALALYAVAYSFIENRRTRKGPWLVTFTYAPTASVSPPLLGERAGVRASQRTYQTNSQQPSLTINQPWLNLSNVVITFPDSASDTRIANTNETIDFRVPKDVPFNVPFGTCIFEDTTFLPGTIVFKMFGHKIQLIPRVLTVDGKEYPWKSDSMLNVRDAQ
jgi:hypothetical protein